jgi:hypothetical protein
MRAATATAAVPLRPDGHRQQSQAKRRYAQPAPHAPIIAQSGWLCGLPGSCGDGPLARSEAGSHVQRCVRFAFISSSCPQALPSPWRQAGQQASLISLVSPSS